MPRTMGASRILVINRRFRGPPTSGNGGYTCGMLAAVAAKPVEVRLIRPLPLDAPLAIEDDPATSGLVLKDGDEIVATADAEDFRSRRAASAFLRTGACGRETLRGFPGARLLGLFCVRPGAQPR